MNENQTAATKKGGFIHKPGIVPVANVQATGGCCGQSSNTLILISGGESQTPAAVSGCCGETVSNDAGSTGCCGEPAEKQGCCG